MQRDRKIKSEKLDLWTDSDDHRQGLSQTAEHGRTGPLRSTRRLSDTTMLSALRDWLLQDYASAYCRSLAASRIFRRCYWIDALGLDAHLQPSSAHSENGSTTPPVSKVRKKAAGATPLALRPIVSLAQTLAQESKPITFYGLLVVGGSSKRKVTHDAQTLSPTIPIPKESGILPVSWSEIAESLLKEIEQSPAIFLLNPLGTPPFSYDDLAAIYQRAVPTELCLLLTHKQIEVRLLAAQRLPEQSAALTALLRTDRWKSLPLAEGERSQAISGFIDLFIACMQRHFQHPVQPISFPVPSGPAHLTLAPYTLLFATRRQDSLVSMNDAVCSYRQSSEEQSYRGVLSEEWFLSQQRERLNQSWQQLYQTIKQAGSIQRARRWPDLRQQVLTTQFGQFMLHDYDTVIRQLILNNVVTCTWRQSASFPEQERTPANEDTLIWR